MIEATIEGNDIVAIRANRKFVTDLLAETGDDNVSSLIRRLLTDEADRRRRGRQADLASVHDRPLAA